MPAKSELLVLHSAWRESATRLMGWRAGKSGLVPVGELGSCGGLGLALSPHSSVPRQMSGRT